MRPARKTWAGLLLAGVLLAGPDAAAQPQEAGDWPVLRGNAAQTGVASTTLPESLAIRWRFRAGANLEGTPVIRAGTVFVASADGKCFALELAGGKKKWEYHADAGILASPAARAGAVCFGDVAGNLHCLDPATGKRLWVLETEGEQLGPANFAGDKILFGSDDHHLYCATLQGKLAWKCATKEKIRSAPAVAGDFALVGACDQFVHVVELATGREVRAIPLGAHVAASVAVRGDHLYVGNMSTRFAAIDWKKGTSLWDFEPKRAEAFHSSPAVTEEVVVVGSRDRHLRALKRQTGQELWAFRTGGRVEGSPAIVGPRVVVNSLDGILYVLDLARGTETARFELGAMAGSPAVADQAIVVTTVAGEVICIGASAAKK
jgi:outer membrane protein assembly factor BamB